MVTTTSDGLEHLTAAQFEAREILLLCRRPQSIAEVAAWVRIPLGVARVLVSDLTAGGPLAVQAAAGEQPDRAILERLLAGLRAR